MVPLNKSSRLCTQHSIGHKCLSTLYGIPYQCYLINGFPILTSPGSGLAQDFYVVFLLLMLAMPSLVCASLFIQRSFSPLWFLFPMRQLLPSLLQHQASDYRPNSCGPLFQDSSPTQFSSPHPLFYRSGLPRSLNGSPSCSLASRLLPCGLSSLNFYSRFVARAPPPLPGKPCSFRWPSLFDSDPSAGSLSEVV